MEATSDMIFSESLRSVEKYISGRDKVLILVDDNTREHCLPLLELPGDQYCIFSVGKGEKHKNIHTVVQCWSKLLEMQADRNSLVVNLGGGVVCDLGGFAASTYKRGIAHIHVPTTLLAQVDACIGGKTAVNLHHIRNAVGSYKQAEKIIIHTGFLSTLPAEQLYSGFAEMLKHALIHDKEQWETLGESSPEQMIGNEKQIRRSMDIKQRIVQDDPYESGGRKKLNFGHTIGHALEAVYLKSNQIIPHGFAVSAGMLCAAYLSVQLCGLSHTELTNIENVLKKHFRFFLPEMPEFDLLLPFLMQDKKHSNGAVRFTLITQIGDASIDRPCSQKMIRQATKYYQSLLRSWR